MTQRHFLKQTLLMTLALGAVSMVAPARAYEDPIARFNRVGGHNTAAMDAAATSQVQRFSQTAGKPTAEEQAHSQSTTNKWASGNSAKSSAETEKARESANVLAQTMRSPLFRLAGH